MSSFTIELTSWQVDEPALSDIRQTVFIEEQKVPLALEWDGLDADAKHLLARDCDGTPIGCARILDSRLIGRMAILPAWRNQGIGMSLLRAAIEYGTEQGWHEIGLSAQIHAIGFYEQAGFEICSDPYMDAGIPHRDMKLNLST